MGVRPRAAATANQPPSECLQPIHPAWGHLGGGAAGPTEFPWGPPRPHGRPLGYPMFVERLEKLVGRIPSPRKPGRKSRLLKRPQ